MIGVLFVYLHYLYRTSLPFLNHFSENLSIFLSLVFHIFTLCRKTTFSDKKRAESQ